MTGDEDARAQLSQQAAGMSRATGAVLPLPALDPFPQVTLFLLEFWRLICHFIHFNAEDGSVDVLQPFSVVFEGLAPVVVSPAEFY